MISKKILNQIKSSPGFSKNLSLNDSDFKILREAIYSQWLETINTYYPELSRYIKQKNLDIKDYHEISYKIDHSKIWSKSSRILPCKFFRNFINSNFFKELQSIFGNIEISDEENLGFGNIYWRLVRPNESADIGPWHRDSWFWELNNNFPKPNYPFSRVKVWIAVETEIGKNGLLVENNSHKRNNIKWEGIYKHGIIKPKIVDNIEKFDMKLVSTNPKETILFNDKLLHGGALNKGKHTRVSTEFTILVNEN